MKAIGKTIQYVALVSICLGFSSCATILTKSTTQVVIVSPPADLKVYEDGKELPVEMVVSHAKSHGVGEGSSISLYSSKGVMVSKKTKRHKLTLESQGKKTDVNMRTKVDGGFLFLDIITGFI